MASTHSPSRRPSDSSLSSFVRWLQLKKYQYEVTFSLYMLTSTEKVIFNSIIFILFSLLITAAFLYLPDHIVIICHRLWYYAHGESYDGSAGPGGLTNVAKAMPGVAAATADAVRRNFNEL